MEQHTDNHERILIQALKEGSRKAFDAIYQMYAKRLYAYSIQYTKSAPEAEDIVQEVFINLWNYKESIRQKDTLCSLLFVMAKHRLINAYRAKVNSLEYEEYINTSNRVEVEDPHKKIEYADFLDLLSTALSKLPTTQQRVIRLSRLKELSNKEIAETLSLSEQTVKNQLSLGLRTLREKIVKAGALFSLFIYC
jgi:RNA polymerase sigma-70 factor (ECF subfamily)